MKSPSPSTIALKLRLYLPTLRFLTQSDAIYWIEEAAKALEAISPQQETTNT